MSDNELLRNPSPPPLTDEEKAKLKADYIGESLFSKKWVLNVIFKLFSLKEEEIYDTQLKLKQNFLESNSEQRLCNESNNDNLKELLGTFEDEICELWDISANSDVSTFLYENDSQAILMYVLDKTQSPRLLEICFGILGNMACVEKVALGMISDETFCDTLLEYLSLTDSLSLVELTRLLCVLMSHEVCLEKLIKSFETSSLEPHPVDQLVRILQNSLNVNIVMNIVEILDLIFDNSDKLMELHCKEILNCLLDVYYILNENSMQEPISNLLHILQSFTTTVSCVCELLKHDSLVVFLCSIFAHLLSGNNPRVKDQCLQSFYSVLSCLLSGNAKAVLSTINENYNLLVFLIDILNEKLTEYDTNEEAELNHIYLMVYLEPFHDIFYNLTICEEHFGNLFQVLKDKKILINNIIDLCTVIGMHSEDFAHFSENLATFNENLNL
ncbi:protein saal1 [Hydra vulgaris]|nr:protein saal1-like [Hydra vulgaris]